MDILRATLVAVLVLGNVCETLPRAMATEATESVALPRDQEDFHLYLLLGQSNMAGRGKMTPADKTPTPGVLTMGADDQWRPASHPLHFDKPSMTGVGLGIDFAKAMREVEQQPAIGLIPCAFGGTSLDQWSKGTKLYDEALRRARIGAKSGIIRGVLWHQGEADSTADLAPTYAVRLGRFITDLRNDLGEPELPFVLGELGRFRQAKNGFTAEINRQLSNAATDVTHVELATSEGLRDHGDQTHFDADSLREFGRRYAAKMKLLQNER